MYNIRYITLQNYIFSLKVQNVGLGVRKFYHKIIGFVIYHYICIITLNQTTIMKNWLVFLLGFIVGIVCTIFAAVIIADSQNNDKGMTFFEQPGECLGADRFEVLQAIGGNYALAYKQEYDRFLGYTNTSLLVLVTNDNGEYYYDEQVIKVPKGKCMRQVGIYKYQTKSEAWKTVPIVKLMDK